MDNVLMFTDAKSEAAGDELHASVAEFPAAATTSRP